MQYHALICFNLIPSCLSCWGHQLTIGVLLSMHKKWVSKLFDLKNKLELHYTNLSCLLLKVDQCAQVLEFYVVLPHSQVQSSEQAHPNPFMMYHQNLDQLQLQRSEMLPIFIEVQRAYTEIAKIGRWDLDSKQHNGQLRQHPPS